MIITNSNQLHDQLWIYVRQKDVLGSWKLSFSYIDKKIFKKSNQNQNLVCFRPIFDFELKGKRSRAEPSWAGNLSTRALAWASLARLGLITNQGRKWLPVFQKVFFLNFLLVDYYIIIIEKSNKNFFGKNWK